MDNRWTIRYFKEGKRTALSLFADSFPDAVTKWAEHTKTIHIKLIYQITNETVLTECDHCLKYPPMDDILGDGYCPKHKLRYVLGNIKNPCPMCANELGWCHSCGKDINEHNK